MSKKKKPEMGTVYFAVVKKDGINTTKFRVWINDDENNQHFNDNNIYDSQAKATKAALKKK